MTILDTTELARLLEAGEGRQVEFKEGLAADGRVARTICAFANTRGGILLIGVSDRGRVLGVGRPGSVAEGVRELARHAVDPPVDVRIEVVRSGGRPIVACSVPLSPARPHGIAPGEVLVRSGSSNRVATAAAREAVLPPADALDAADRRILAAVAKSGPTTIAAFARAHGVGRQKTRQALERLERAGHLVAHGLGERRAWERAT